MDSNDDFEQKECCSIIKITFDVRQISQKYLCIIWCESDGFGDECYQMHFKFENADSHLIKIIISYS